MKKLFASVGVAVLLAVGLFVSSPTKGSVVNPQQAGACSFVYQGQSTGATQVYSYLDQHYHWINFALTIYFDNCATYKVISAVNTSDQTNLYGGIAKIRVWLSNGNYYGGVSGCNTVSNYWYCEEVYLVYTGYGISTDNYQSGVYSTNYSPNSATHYLKQNARI